MDDLGELQASRTLLEVVYEKVLFKPAHTIGLNPNRSRVS
jgi:hypothetical protein